MTSESTHLKNETIFIGEHGLSQHWGFENNNSFNNLVGGFQLNWINNEDAFFARAKYTNE